MNSIFNLLNKISSTKIAYFIILIFAVTVYSRTFSFGFVQLDDIDIVNGIGLACTSLSPMEIVTHEIINQKAEDVFVYRPIVSYTFIIDYLINGEKPMLYHVTNLILHVLVCMVLFSLLKKLGFDRGISFLMTLLYTVHPFFNQAVAWIPPRADLLMCLFGILSFVALIKYFEENSGLYLAAHLIAFFASVFSKETAILFPVLYGLFYYFKCYHKGEKKLFDMKVLRLLVAWILIVGIFLFMRATVIKEGIKPENIGITVFLSNIWYIPEFIAKFFVPIKLNGMPQFSVLISSIGISIMVGMTIFSILNRKYFNYLSFIGIVWFLIFTAVSMTFHQGQWKTCYDYLEHRAYLPSVGLVIFILSFVAEGWKVRLICGLIPLIFVYSAYSFVNTNKFKDPISFYNSIIGEGTNVAKAYSYRAGARLSSGDKKGAIEDYLKAISIKSDYAEVYYCKGHIEREMKEYEFAIDDFTKAIKAKTNYVDAYLSRGAVYCERGLIKQRNGDKHGANGDFLLAIDDCTKAIKAKPAHVGAYSNRGDIFFKMNRREDAIADYNRAIEIDPKYSGSYNNLGILYASEGDYLESIKYFTKAIECDNKFGNAYMNRGLAYLFLGDKRKACENFKLSMEFGCDAGKQLYEKHRLTPE